MRSIKQNNNISTANPTTTRTANPTAPTANPTVDPTNNLTGNTHVLGFGLDGFAGDDGVNLTGTTSDEYAWVWGMSRMA